MFVGYVVRFGVVALEVIEFQSRVFRANEPVIAANDGLAVARFVDDEITMALMSGPEERWSDGYAVNAQGNRRTGKLAEGGKQISDIDNPVAVRSSLEHGFRVDLGGPAHNERHADAAFLDLPLVAAQAAVGV